MPLFLTLLAFQTETGPPQAGNPLLGFMPFILLFLIFYFLIIRPQSKRQREHQMMIRTLEKGDRVVTSGGIHGTIRGINEDKDTVQLEVAEKVRLEVTRASIGRVLTG